MEVRVAHNLREEIKTNLAQCTHRERVNFVHMYGPKEHRTDPFLYNVDAIAKHHIDQVVDQMPSRKLIWADQQVAETLTLENRT